MTQRTLGGEQHEHRAPTDCPVCGDHLSVTRLGCTSCGTELAGMFAACPFCSLGEKDLSLLRVFLTSRGNMREVEKHLGVSYPTARQRFTDVLVRLGLADEPAPPARRGSRSWPTSPPAPSAPTKPRPCSPRLAGARRVQLRSSRADSRRRVRRWCRLRMRVAQIARRLRSRVTGRCEGSGAEGFDLDHGDVDRLAVGGDVGNCVALLLAQDRGRRAATAGCRRWCRRSCPTPNSSRDPSTNVSVSDSSPSKAIVTWVPGATSSALAGASPTWARRSMSASWRIRASC